MRSKRFCPSVVLIQGNRTDAFLLEQAVNEHSVDCRIQLLDDGDKALRFASSVERGETGAPDLVVLDLSLPRHDGMKVLTRLKCCGALHGVPVVVMTSPDSVAETQQASALGADELVRKPNQLEEFLAVGGRVKELLHASGKTA